MGSFAVTLCAAPDRLDREFSLWHQTVLHGEECGRGSRGHADLDVRVLNVVVSCLHRDSQGTCDLLGLQPAGQEADDLCLAMRQPSRPLDPRGPLSGGLEDGHDGDGIEPSNVDLSGECLGGLLGSQRLSVRPRLDLRLIGVCRGQQAGLGSQPGRGRPAVIARPVTALVMRAGNPSEPGQEGRAVEDALGLVRVQAHLLPVVRCQATRLLPDAGRNGYPPDVMDKRRASNQRDVRPVEAVTPGGFSGQIGHAG